MPCAYHRTFPEVHEKGCVRSADPVDRNVAGRPQLTSGYYHGEDRSPPRSITNGHKDRHGGPFDTLSPIDFGLGLNRDSNDLAFSPQFAQHENAAALAGEASKRYIREVNGQLTQQQVALLLGKGPTLGIVIDTTNSMGSILSAVRDAATQLVNASVGTANEPSQYVLGQINDPVTPPPTVTADVDQGAFPVWWASGPSRVAARSPRASPGRWRGLTTRTDFTRAPRNFWRGRDVFCRGRSIPVDLRRRPCEAY